jgi:hypothetical protein
MPLMVWVIQFPGVTAALEFVVSVPLIAIMLPGR